MRRLHLIRHASTIIDPATSSSDWVLAPNVEPAIRTICSRLDASKIYRVVSSPQAKAIQTAQHVADFFDIPLEIRQGLEEHRRTKRDFIDDEIEFRKKIAEFFARPRELVFGQESADQASTRIYNAVNTLMDESDNDELIVSHGTVISLFLARGMPNNQMNIWSSLQFPDYVPLNWPCLQRIDE